MSSFIFVCHLTAAAAWGVTLDGNESSSECACPPSTTQHGQVAHVHLRPHPCNLFSDRVSFLQVEQSVSSANNWEPSRREGRKESTQQGPKHHRLPAVLAAAHRDSIEMDRNMTENSTLLAACLAITMVTAIYFCVQAALSEETIIVSSASEVATSKAAQDLLERCPGYVRQPVKQPSSGAQSGLSQVQSAATSLCDWSEPRHVPVPNPPIQAHALSDADFKSDVDLLSDYNKDADYKNELDRFCGDAIEFTSVSLAVNGYDILKNVTGTVESRRVTAIIGDSKCGSSALLQILAGRLKTEDDGVEYGGKLSYNGRPVPKLESLLNYTGYVPRDICAATFDTVGEYLEFAANLRLPRSEGPASRATSALKGMRLDHHSPIGALSAAQRKRILIAVELLNCPKMLFLDSPFSEMGAFDAFNLAEALGELTKGYPTSDAPLEPERPGVVCSVQAPSWHTFEEFNDIIIMHRGAVAFCGPKEDMMHYLSEFDHPCPEISNPADHVMFVMDRSDKYDHKIAEKLKDDWLSDKRRNDMEKKIINRREPRREPSGDFVEKAPLPEPRANPSSPGIWTQLVVLMQRDARNMLRNTTMHQICICVSILLSLLVAIVFEGEASRDDDPEYSGSNCRPDMYNSYDCNVQFQLHLRCLALLLIMAVIAGLLPVLGNLPAEKRIFTQERASNMYGALPYIIAKAIVNLPTLFLVVMVFWCIDYKSLGLGGPFLPMVLLAWMSLATATILAVGIGMAFPRSAKALPILVLASLMIGTFTGVFMEVKYIKPWFGWFEYCMPMKFALNCLGAMEFSFLQDAIEDCESKSDQPTAQSREDECKAMYPGDYLRRDLMEAMHIYPDWFAWDLCMAIAWVVIAILAATAMLKIGDRHGKSLVAGA